MVQKFINRIADNFHMPFLTVAQQVEILNSLPDRLASWTTKGEVPKRSMWFSWRSVAHSQLPEWWASRMVLEWYTRSNDDSVTVNDLSHHSRWCKESSRSSAWPPLFDTRHLGGCLRLVIMWQGSHCGTFMSLRSSK